jgi:hypothetical protein
MGGRVVQVVVKLWTMETAQASLVYVGPIADELRKVARRVECLDRDVVRVEVGLDRRRSTGALMMDRRRLVRRLMDLVRELHGAGVRVVSLRSGRLAWSTGDRLGSAGLTWCPGESHVQPYAVAGGVVCGAGSAPAEAGRPGRGSGGDERRRR